MRIRKRPPPTVEAARAAPVFENKPESAPKSLHAEVQIANRSERLDGGGVELSPVVSERRHIHIHLNSEHVVQNNDSIKQTEETGTELLMKSLLVVFERAGARGLTAREAAAKLVEYELPGLQEGQERFSVQVAKVLRTPDFVHLEDGKYFIYPSTPHAIVAESSTQSEQPPPQQQQEEQQQQQQQQALFQDINQNSVPTLNGGRRKRAPVKIVVAASFSENNTTSEFSDKNGLEKIELKKRRRRPPSSQHELAIGPRQCKRYDGRGWQCTRETEEGFSFCEHHQALMHKRTLRLNLAKKRRKGGTNDTKDMDVEQQPKASENTVVVAPHGIEDLIHNQRRRLVKARSLKSIK